MPDDIKLIPPGAEVFTDRDVLTPRESDEGPGVLGTVADVGLGMARTGVGAVRSLGTVPGRMMEEQPGWVTSADQGLRHVDETLESWQSQRARNAEKAKLFPGRDDYRASDMPVAYTLHHIANLAPWLVGGALAAGATGLSGGAAAPVVGAALWSALSGGDYIKQAYDTADKTPIQALQQLPKWNEYLEAAGGSEAGARAQVAKDMIDGRALMANMAAGAVPGMLMGKGAGAIGQMIRPTAKGAGHGVIRSGLVGSAEGVGGMGLQAGVLDVTGQVGEQNVGLRKDLDYEQTTGRMLESVAPGLLLGGVHATKAALGRQPQGAIDTEPKAKVDTSEVGEDKTLALNATLNKGQMADATGYGENVPYTPVEPTARPADLPAAQTPVAPRAPGTDLGTPKIQTEPMLDPRFSPQPSEPNAPRPAPALGQNVWAGTNVDRPPQPPAPPPAPPTGPQGRPMGQFARQRSERGGEWTAPEARVESNQAELPNMGAPVAGAIDVSGRPVAPQAVGAAGMARERRGGDRTAVQMPNSWDLMNQRAQERTGAQEAPPPDGAYWKHPRLGNVPVRIVGEIERGTSVSGDRFERTGEYDAVKVRPEGAPKDGSGDVVVPLDQLVIPSGTRRAGGRKAPVTPLPLQPGGKPTAGQTAIQKASRGTAALPPALAALQGKITAGAPTASLGIRDAAVLEKLRKKAGGGGTEAAPAAGGAKLKNLRDKLKGSKAAPKSELGNAPDAPPAEGAPVTGQVTGAAPRGTLRLNKDVDLDKVRAQAQARVDDGRRTVTQTVPLGGDTEGRFAWRDENTITGAKPTQIEDAVVGFNRRGKPVREKVARAAEVSTGDRDPYARFGENQAGTRPVPDVVRKLESKANEVKGEQSRAAEELTSDDTQVNVKREVVVQHKDKEAADKAANEAMRERKRKILARKAGRTSSKRTEVEKKINDFVNEIRRGAPLQSVVHRAKDLASLMATATKANRHAAREDERQRQRVLREQVTKDTFDAAYGEASGDLMETVMTAASKTKNRVSARRHEALAADATSAPGSARTIFERARAKKNEERVQYKHGDADLLNKALQVQEFAKKIIDRVDTAWEAMGKEAGSHAKIWDVNEGRSGGPDAPWYSAAARIRKFIETIDRLRVQIARRDGEITPGMDEALREALQKFGDLVALGAEEAHKTRRLESKLISENKTQSGYQRFTRAWRAEREREGIEASRDDAEGAPDSATGERGLGTAEYEQRDRAKEKAETTEVSRPDELVDLEEAANVADTTLMDREFDKRIDPNADLSTRKANERHDERYPDNLDHRDPEMRGKIGKFSIDDLPNDPETLRRAAEAVARERRDAREQAAQDLDVQLRGDQTSDKPVYIINSKGERQLVEHYGSNEHDKVMRAGFDPGSHAKLVAEAANILAARIAKGEKDLNALREAGVTERVTKDAAGKPYEFSPELGDKIHTSLVRALNNLAEHIQKRPLKLGKAPKPPSRSEIASKSLEEKVDLGWPLTKAQMEKLEEWASHKVRRTPEERAQGELLEKWQANNTKWRSSMVSPRKSTVKAALRDRKDMVDSLQAIAKGMNKGTRTAREAVEKLVELHGLVANDPKAQNLRDQLAPLLRQFHVWQEAKDRPALEAALEQIRQEEASLANRMAPTKDLPAPAPGETFTDKNGVVHQLPPRRPDSMADPRTQKSTAALLTAKVAEEKAKADAERDANNARLRAINSEVSHLLQPGEIDPAKATTSKVRNAADELSAVMRAEGLAKEPKTKAERMQPVNWAFTRIARKLVKNVKVVEVTPEVMQRLIEWRDPTGPRDAPAFYDWKTDRIFTTVGVNSRSYGHTLRHEVVHAITDGAFHRTPHLLRKLNVLRQIAHENYTGQRYLPGDRLSHDMYGLSSTKEFLSEALSNPEFQAFLAGVKLKKGDALRLAGVPDMNLMQAAAHLIRNVLNKVFSRDVAEQSLLGHTLNEAFALFEHTRQQGRAAWSKEHEATVSYLSSLDKIGQVLKDTREHVRGARGLWLHTMGDLADRGRENYKQLTRQYYSTVAQMNRFAEREMRQPLTRDMMRAVGQLQKLPEGVRDKVFDVYTRADAHGLDPRYGMKEGPNEKVYQEKGFRHEQVRQTHDQLQGDVAALSKISGAREAYEAIHEWAHGMREKERVATSRQMIEMLPEVDDEHGVTDPLAVSALHKWVLGAKKHPLSTEEQAWIDARRKPDDPDTNADIARAKFDRFVNSIREGAHLEELNGFWLPRQRTKGDWVVSGHWDLPEPTNGRKIKSDTDNTMDTGRVEFDDPSEIPGYVKKVTEMGLTQRSAGRTVYNPDGTEAVRFEPAASTVIDGPIDSSNYVMVTRGVEKRITPAEVEAEIARGEADGKVIKHWVSFGNIHMQRVDGEMEARRVYEQLRVDKPSLNVGSPERVHDFEKGYINQHLMATQLGQLIARTKRSAAFAKLNDAQQGEWINELRDQAARTIQATGGRSPFLGRKYATGVDRDLMHTLAVAASRSAHRLGHAIYGNDLLTQAAAIQKYLRDQKFGNTAAPDLNMNDYHNDYALESGVWREMERRVYSHRADFAENTWDRVTNRLMQMTYTAKLAGTSFLMINALEAAVIGLPIMAGKYGAADSVRMMHEMYNTVGGWRVMKQAGRDFRQSFKQDFVSSDLRETIVNNIMSNRKLSDAKKLQYAKAVDNFIEHGLMDPEAVNELTLLRTESSNRLGKWADQADIAMRTINGGVEQMNRAVLGLSAFELELRRSDGNVDKALEAGRRMILDGAGNAAAWNAPPIMNNRYLRPTMQFKKYPQRIIGNYVRAISHSLDKGPEGAEARKKLMYMLAMQAAVAGLAGLPSEPISVPVNAAYLAGLSPVNADDLRAQLQKKLVEMGGKDFGEYAMHGLLRATGTAVGSRMSHADLVTYGSLKDQKPDTALLGLAHLMLGAPGGQAVDMAKGLTDIVKGGKDYYSGAREQGLDRMGQGVRPLLFVRQLGDIWDAFAGASQGNITNETAGGKRVKTQLTPGEQVSTALGLQPARVANRQLARRTMDREIRAENEQKNSYVQAWARANPSDKRRIEQAIQEQFNAGRPQGEWITFSDLQRGKVAYERNQRQSPDQLGLSPNKRTQHVVSDWGRVFNL